MRAGSVHVRHAIVEVQCVNVVIGVLLCVLLVVVRVVPINLPCLVLYFSSLVSHSHSFLVAIFHVCFAVR